MTDADGDGTEELRVGRDPVPGRLRRPTSVVAVAVLGLAVAWVTTRLGEDGGSSAGPTPPVSSAVASPSANLSVASPTPGLSFVPVPGGSTVRVFPASTALPEPACPAGARCETTFELPAAVTAALRANYPGARVVSSSTVTRTVAGRTSLVGRSIKAVAGPRRFEIVVGPYVMGPDGFDRENRGRTSTVSVDSATPGQTVRLVLTEPRTARPNDLTVLRLARDPRLAAQ